MGDPPPSWGEAQVWVRGRGSGWTGCPEVGGTTGGAGLATATFWSWWNAARAEPWVVEVRK